MRRWFGVASAVLWIGAALAGGTISTRAQGDAVGRIEAAYQARDGWRTFRVEVEESSSYAVTAQGKGASLWQRQERDIMLSGAYDLSDSTGEIVLLNVSSTSDGSTDDNGTITPLTWKVDMEAALVDGSLLWRGSYDGGEADRFTLPDDWESFSVREASSAPGLADLALGRYLLQSGDDPFVGDISAWLENAESIEGPRAFNLDKQTLGDLYVVDVNLADVPDVLAGRFGTLTNGPDAVIERAALLDALYADSTLTWGVVLDPESGQLLAHFTRLELNAAPDADVLTGAYESFSLAFSDDLSVSFSAVNEPVDLPDLPG